uniref:Uncharacterized protein n=1 Tax=Panagrolaimus superbus TaxID=310955 RepID=A0A914XVT2_9BILA
MLHSDKALLALLLLRIYLKCHTNDNTYEAKFDHFLLRSELFMSEASKTLHEAAKRNPIPPLTDDQVVSLMQLSRLPEFKEIVKKIQAVSDLSSWMNSDNPEHEVPEVATYEGNPSATSRALNDLLVIHALRPDRLVAAAHLVISSTFGLEFMQQDKVTNLHEIIESEVTD